MHLYLAGPLFTQSERRWLRALAEGLRERGHSVFLPQDEAPDPPDPQRIYEIDRGGLDAAEAVVAVLDGADADSGTSWECGYAIGRAIPVIGVRTDFRTTGDDDGLNLMLRRSARAIVEHPAADERIEPLVDGIDRALRALRPG